MISDQFQKVSWELPPRTPTHYFPDLIIEATAQANLYVKTNYLAKSVMTFLEVMLPSSIIPVQLWSCARNWIHNIHQTWLVPSTVYARGTKQSSNLYIYVVCGHRFICERADSWLFQLPYFKRKEANSCLLVYIWRLWGTLCLFVLYACFRYLCLHFHCYSTHHVFC